MGHVKLGNVWVDEELGHIVTGRVSKQGRVLVQIYNSYRKRWIPQDKLVRE